MEKLLVIKCKQNYNKDLDSGFIISVENGIITTSPNSNTGSSRLIGNYKEIAYIKAKEIKNKVFNYIVDENNQIMTYNKTLTTYIKCNKEYKCVYSDNEVEKKPLVTLNKSIIDYQNNTIKFDLSCFIPNNYTKTEWGVLVINSYNHSELIDKELTCDNVPEGWKFKETLYPTNLNVSNGGYDLEISSNDWWVGEDTFQARAYAVLTNPEGNTEYIYSSVTASHLLYKE